MRRTLATLLATMMLLTLGAGTVTATGNSVASLNECTNEINDYAGGIKVYARDKVKGASRVMCPEGELEIPAAIDGLRLDRNLNARNRSLPPLQDIWNGFFKNIESFKLRAAAGCEVLALLLLPGDLADLDEDVFNRVLDNTAGAFPKTMRYEVPRGKDNKAVAVAVAAHCPEPPDPPDVP